MNWNTNFITPSRGEIEAYQRSSTRRSPYICANFCIPQGTRFREYSVDFRALHLPRGTYCCLGGWAIHRPGLTPQNPSLCRTDAYAGFQRIQDDRTTSIMSVWDVKLWDAEGRERFVQAKRVFPPEVIDGGRFWGEGDGERSSAPYNWGPNRWYRMHLRIVSAGDTSYLEQWVTDLQTMERRLLCIFDVCVPDSSFESMYIFLENYLTETSGEVRSMQVRNARYLPVGEREWRTVKSAWVGSQGGLPAYEGSYDFGTSPEGLWMITSGVGGDWYGSGKGKQTMELPIP